MDVLREKSICLMSSSSLKMLAGRKKKLLGSKRWDVLVAVNKFMGIINNGRQTAA